MLEELKKSTYAADVVVRNKLIHLTNYKVCNKSKSVEQNINPDYQNLELCLTAPRNRVAGSGKMAAAQGALLLCVTVTDL